MTAPRSLRIGMLTPSSNTVVEPYTAALLAPLFPAVTAHFARLRVTRIALDDASNAQFALEPFLAAADLLVDAKVDVIVWNGTSASWLGPQGDEALVAAIKARHGIPATTAVLGLRRLMARQGITRVALVSPYTRDVQDRIVARLAESGIETTDERHCGISDNFSFAEIPEDEIADLCRAVAKSRPQAVIVMCTNMRGPLVAARLEAECGVQMLDSVAFALEAAFAECGYPTTALAQFGRLFG